MKSGAMYLKALSHAASMPYDNFSNVEMAALENALRLSWKEAKALQSDFNVDFLTCDEETISIVLFEVMATLANRRNGPLRGLLTHFDLPIAEGTLRSFAHPPPPPVRSPKNLLARRKPDFAFRRKRTPDGVNRVYCAAFIEAKIVAPGKGMRWYTLTGLRRFITGAYASSMGQGIMLAYVRGTTHSLPVSLNDYLAPSARKKDYNVRQDAMACGFSVRSPLMHESRHSRKWKYEATKTSPGPVQIFHLWLDC